MVPQRLILLFSRSTVRLPVRKVASAYHSFSSMASSSMNNNASSSNSTSSDFYTVGITGSTGLLGTALMDQLVQHTPHLHDKPIRIIRFNRSTPKQVQQVSSLQPPLDSTTTTTPSIYSIPWNPYGEGDSTKEDWCIHPNILGQLDAIVHLAGENVATSLFLPGPLKELGLQAWTPEKKKKIIDSRVVPTRNLARALAQKCTTTRPTTFLVASGIGIYGYHYHQTNTTLPTQEGYHSINNEETVTTQTQGFLAHVSRVWEEATLVASPPSSHAPPRVVQVRLAPILSTHGGALAKLLPIFKLGGGGILGPGTQYFSFISARDASRALIHILHDSSLQGPVNVVAPIPCTNYEFTKTLGKVLWRPTLIPMPSFLVKILFGEMGEEMFLGGVVACPKKLMNSGFVFQHSSIELALKSALQEKI